ncbi:MAG TPA: heme o synthase [Bacillales bacterium]|nr:heme o synthase [Bacillales bacterium]
MATTKTSSVPLEDQTSSLLLDLKELFKAIVLISNVLPVFAGFWAALSMADRSFAENWPLFVLTIVGSTFVMAGALVINNWYDVDIDRIMARTQKRPTVTGHFSLKKVLAAGIALSALGFLLLLFTTFEATVYAFIGWFTYVFLYTMWSKRRFTLNTVIGSISGAVTPLIGWAAVQPANHIVPVILFLVLFMWQMPHTFVIAIRKYDEYKAAKVPMLPVVYGFPMTKRQTVVYIACMLPLPFFLMSTLGLTFVVIATVLNLGFLALAISGFFENHLMKWAQRMFLYSVNYVMLFFLLVIAVTM